MCWNYLFQLKRIVQVSVTAYDPNRIGTSTHRGQILKKKSGKVLVNYDSSILKPTISI